MKLKMGTLASALALGLSVMAAPSFGATITNTDGTFNFTGFDWDSNGTAFTSGFAPTAGKDFTLGFFSWAANVKDGATNLHLNGLDSNANGIAEWSYEYTVVATLHETVTSCSADGSQCNFQLNSGTFSVYYDLSQDANGKTGTGFTDGTLLISGTFGSQIGGTFTVGGTGGSGSTTINGNVLTTNLSYINPALTTTTATTTLQLGSSITNDWTNPGAFNGTPFDPDAIVFQADANQSFAATVPEPETLALVGVALVAGGLASRRRAK